MADHCVYAICSGCKGEYCLRGCNYTCDCGKRVPDQDQIKKAQEIVDRVEREHDSRE